MYSVRITDVAEDDMEKTVQYIAEILEAPVAANNVLDEIEKHENLLEDTPQYGFIHIRRIFKG